MQLHREISTIRDSSLKVRCEKLISGAEKQLRQAASTQKTAERLGGIQSELQEAGTHIRRAGRTLLGRPEPEDAEYGQNRGLLGKAQTVIGRMRNSLSSMAARTAQLVDRLTSERETPDSRQSVKEALRDLQAEQKYGEDFHVPAEPVR